MRQFSTTLGKEIFRGLRPDYRVSRNSEGLVVLLNAETSEGGLATYDDVTNPVSTEDISAYGLALEWPYPQLFRGNGQTLIASKAGVYSVNEADWSLVPLEVYNAHSTDDEVGLTLGEAWQFVDMGKAWMLLNGTSTVFLPGHQAMLGHQEKVLSQDSIGVRTGCYHKGRVILGGFTVDEFWHDRWSAFWKDWAGRRELGIVPSMEIGENYVWWSTIGGGDVFSLIYPELVIEGMLGDEDYNDRERPMIFDLLLRNECGMMPVLKGAIRVVKPLGPFVAVYSDGGVAVLKPVSVEGATTMGMQVLSTMGVANGIPVAGNDLEHVFVDQSGTLWSLKADLSLTKLGYREFFFDMLSGQFMSSFSPEDGGKWFFSDGTTTYLYKHTGMSQVDQLVTSCDFAAGTTVGMADEAGSRNPLFGLTTGDIDFGMRGIKHLHSVELSTNSTENLYVSVYYKYNKAETEWKQTVWRRVNKEGWVVVACSGVDFRIAVKGDDFTGVEPPDYITLKWSLADKRNQRSQYDRSGA